MIIFLAHFSYFFVILGRGGGGAPIAPAPFSDAPACVHKSVRHDLRIKGEEVGTARQLFMQIINGRRNYFHRKINFDYCYRMYIVHCKIRR